MKVRVYEPDDCDRSLLEDQTIVIVGYGSQGRAWALNLRDSDCTVSVALRDGSDSIKKAAKDWIEATGLDAAREADIVVLAIPDHVQPEFYKQYLDEDEKEGRLLVFLSGMNIHFGNIKAAPHQDIVLIAPHGPGVTLRDRYLAGNSLSCFMAIARDASGKAKDLALALADAIGCAKAGIFETTFRDEAIGDLFGEQVLLVGGLAGLTMTAFDKLVEKGLSPANAYLETVAQLRLLVQLMEQHGPVGMIEAVSKTAAAGSLMAMLLMFSEDFDRAIDTIYNLVESGEFNKFLMTEAERGFPRTEEMLKDLHQDISQKTSEKFRDEWPGKQFSD
jgi:ketol-acid reductoisomerase